MPTKNEKRRTKSSSGTAAIRSEQSERFVARSAVSFRKNIVFFLLSSVALATFAVNPYLPLWEHLPDGEPRVFDDPDNPGRQRIYIVGSHDVAFHGYCGPDIHIWSAPVDDLSSWRDEGPAFTYCVDGRWDTMFAPDLVELPSADGKRYVLYPHSRGWRREAMVCVGDRPDGPFTPINMSPDGRAALPGSVMGFDPSVFVEPVTDPDDPDYGTGYRAYGYWGFQQSSAAQLDPQTMWSVRPGTDVIPHFIPSSPYYGHPRVVPGVDYAVCEGEDLGDFNFFEASSIRQIGNKYVWVFSGHSGPDYGMGSSNSTLRYAYGDTPLGPWKSGGVLVDSRAPVVNPFTHEMTGSQPGHNTHGSLQQIGGQWYVFYHRSPRGFGFARQAMVAPVAVQCDEQPVSEGGRVVITGYDPYSRDHRHTVTDSLGHEYRGAEVTSEGFDIFGLPPYRYYSAGHSCFLTDMGSMNDTWDVWDNAMDVRPWHPGQIVGYKYFAFSGLRRSRAGLAPFSGLRWRHRPVLNVWVTPDDDAPAAIHVWLDAPTEPEGVLLATLDVPAGHGGETLCLTMPLDRRTARLRRRHALYLQTAVTNAGTLTFHGLGFSRRGMTLQRPVPPTVAITVDGQPAAIADTPIRSTAQNGYCSADTYAVRVPAADRHTVTATASQPEVAITVVTDSATLSRHAPLVPKAAVVADYRGKTKTFLILDEETPDSHE